MKIEDQKLTSRVYSLDRREISNGLLKIGENYFGETLDNNKLTITGFTVDMLSSITESLAITETLRNDEKFIALAKTKDSLKTLAIPFNYKKKHAKPSTAIAVIHITLLDDEVDTFPDFLIPQDTALFIGPNRFSIFSDIVIKRDDRDGINSAYAYYDNYNKDEVTPPLNVRMFDNADGQKVIEMITFVSQREIITRQHIIGVRSAILNYSFTITEKEQISSFEITTSNGKKLVEVDTLLSTYNGDITESIFLLEEDGDKKHIWLDINSKNSEYIKSGTMLNIKYSITNGDIGETRFNEFLTEPPTNIIPREFKITAVNGFRRGHNELTKEEFRIDLIKHIQTPYNDNPISKNDIDNIVFRKLNGNFETKTVLRHHDLNGLIGDVFIAKRMADENGFLLTNTVNVKLTTTDLKNDVHNINVFGLLKQSTVIGDKNYAIINSIENKDLRPTYIDMDFKKYVPIDYYGVTNIVSGEIITKYNFNYIEKYFSITQNTLDARITMATFRLKFEQTDSMDPITGEVGVIDLFVTISKNDKAVVIKNDFDLKVRTKTHNFDMLNVIHPTGLVEDVENKLVSIPVYIDPTTNIVTVGTYALNYSNQEHIFDETDIILRYSVNGVDHEASFMIKLEEFPLFSYKLARTKIVGNDTILYSVPCIDNVELFDYMNNLPVVGGYDNLRNLRNTIHTLDAEVDNLMSSPSDFEVKLFNTSDLYSNFAAGNHIVDSDIKLKVSVRLHNSNFASDTKKEIKRVIKSVIEEMLTVDDGNVYLSRIIQAVENLIASVKYMHVEKPLNNIIKIKESNPIRMDKHNLSLYTPSLVNIKLENIKIIII